MTDSPTTYTPAFCDTVRDGCRNDFREIRGTISKVDSRLFGIIMLLLGNLIAACGGLVFYIITSSNTDKAIENVKSIALGLKANGLIP